MKNSPSLRGAKRRSNLLAAAVLLSACTADDAPLPVVDENTAMVVEADSLSVVGEYGAVVVNLAEASVIDDGRGYSDVLISYLDNGDRYDLRRGKTLPAATKKRARVHP